LADPGRFIVDGGYRSVFGNSAPANVGAFGIHAKGTIDVMPAEIEGCVDTSPSSMSHVCDPINGVGLPVYAPVSSHFITFEKIRDTERVVLAGFITIVIEDEYDGDDINTDMPVRRREIFLAHIDPNTFSNGDQPIKFPPGVNQVTISNVPPGTKIGNLCLHNNRQVCAINDSVIDTAKDVIVVNHLAVQVRFLGRRLSTGRIETDGAYPTEVMGVLADPYCIFDVWKDIHLGSPFSPNKMKAPPHPFIQGWLLSPDDATQNIYAAC
jgi:hypothetical protein